MEIITQEDSIHHEESKEKTEKNEYIVYFYINTSGTWKAQFIHDNQRFVIEGTETQSDQNRNEIQATLEVLQFLRNWITPAVPFTIYSNSQYCITCYYKWIPQWITKGFRIGHTSKMRPNSDLLVKLHAFGTCMEFDLVQHYDDFETYQEIINSI
jgi:ribonuclease HI